jgi:hypothetical protein
MGAVLKTPPATSAASWESYTPTFINLTLGNGFVYSEYLDTTTELRIRGHLIWGTTTSVSDVIGVNFPPGYTSRQIPGSSLSYSIGRGFYFDGDRYDGPVYIEPEASYLLLYYLDSNPKAEPVLGTAPVTWVSGNQWWWDVTLAI